MRISSKRSSSTNLLDSCHGRLELADLGLAVQRCFLVRALSKRRSDPPSARTRRKGSPEALDESFPLRLDRFPCSAIHLLLTLFPQTQCPLLEILEVLEQTRRMTDSRTLALGALSSLLPIQVLLLKGALDLFPD